MSPAKASGAQRRSYRIRVGGSLDPRWSDRLGGLAVISTGKFGVETTTLLEGELPDQGALMGVLNTLHELHLSVEAVESRSPDPSEEVRDQQPE